MNRDVLLHRRNRTHAIVEGALLGDIAIVFLLMRAYLPLPGVRQILRAFASVPFVMLTQRRGLKLAILAAIASYLLFSALVGPLLGLAAVDAAVAGILVGLGRRYGVPAALNTIWSGAAYALLDLIIPTIISVLVFRYPVKQLAQAARNFVKTLFNLVYFVVSGFSASPATLHWLNHAKTATADHWQLAWLGLMAFYGIINMYLVVLVAEIGLRQLPEETLEPQRAAL